MGVRTALLQNTDRRRFANECMEIVGRDNTKCLWLPDPLDGGFIDWARPLVAPSLRAWTPESSLAGRWKKQGNGWLLAMNGTSNYLSTPDAGDLAMGDGTNERNCIWFSVDIVTSGVVARKTLMSKWGPNTDWLFPINTADKLGLVWVNDAATITIRTDGNNVLGNIGKISSYAASYIPVSALGSRANDAAIYENGVSLATTPTNNASYTAAGQTGTAPLEIGSDSAHTAGFGNGYYGMKLFAASSPSIPTPVRASMVRDLHEAARRFYQF